MWNEFLEWVQKRSLYKSYWRWLILEYVLIFLLFLMLLLLIFILQ